MVMATTHMPTRDDFTRYLLAEYENIAQAHFRTIAAISSFFRYYLLITSLPVTLIGVFVGLSSREQPLGILADLGSLPYVMSFVISMVGFLVLLYIINLRMDVLLYARTVNAIRKYFYDRWRIDIEAKLRTRVLPQSPFLPGYTEPLYFLPVVLSFASFDTFYFAWALTPFSVQSLVNAPAMHILLNKIPLYVLLGPIFFFFHIVAYMKYSRYREHVYLKSYALGVDVDGVLNKHRGIFCRLLRESTGKLLNPDHITTIPLHEDPSLGVSREEEKQVFNNPRYWTEMPRADDAPDTIKRLRNIFKLKIHLFTYRPWPSDEKRGGATYKEWIGAASKVLSRNPLLPWGPLRRFRCVSFVYNALNQTRLKHQIRPFALEPIDVVTKCWLHESGIEYDKLTIERGSEDVSDPRGEFKNRFYICRKRKLRFFVEDDAEKARKLAYICDVVFLLDQPYNKSQRGPRNIIRVSSWEEIYRWIRRLS